MKDILICGTWRSGTTMVCEDLTNTGVLGKPREHLNHWKATDEKDWRAELADVRDAGTTPNGVFSTKLMAAHLKDIDAALSTISPPTSKSIFPHLLSAFPNALWVWVRRRDTIGQAVSQFLARRTGVFHLVKDRTGFVPGASSRQRPEVEAYNFKEIVRAWNMMRHHDLLWEAFFSSASIDPMTIWYEDAAENPVGEQVARAAGIELRPYNSIRNLIKLADERSDTIRARFIADFHQPLG